jgi:hypothetical protein
MSAHSIIAGALECELLDYGQSADNEVDAILERIRKALAPNMPRLEYELKTADIRHDAEAALADYVLLNVSMTADAIIEALYEARQTEKEEPEKTT